MNTSKAFREECGVFGIWNDEEASRLTYLGLYALQHRGQESAGIVSLNRRERGPVHFHHKGLGLVADVFKEKDLDRLKGKASIGHVRYSTTGQNLLTNAQPLTAQLKTGPIAIAHNGNIVNGGELREELSQSGAIFQGTNDTEVLLHLIARQPKEDFLKGLQVNIEKLVGAFSLLILSDSRMIAVRDPNGFRPLVLGRRKNTKGEWASVLASETCAFDLIGAEFVREIKPGEIFWVDEEGEHSVIYSESKKLAQCIFEHVYFSRPDSVVFGKSVYEARKEFGRTLATESPIDADIVIPVPDSGVPAAIGYSEKSKIPFELGIIRNHYVGRTFIEPKQSIRSFGVKIKLNPQTAILKGKRIVVVDDSLVRGTTSQKIIQLVRNAGAKEVHLRIAAPPTKGSCYYGVDTPNPNELIANKMSVSDICKEIGADSLAYLSHEGMLNAAGGTDATHCTACFSLKYPTPINSK
ncbi:MAG: amidophosphoribosyltransferase [Bdellovibrionales bacterium]|nr:amidophosphoribosyltransferase [Bdellovibrionales bacterium]